MKLTKKTFIGILMCVMAVCLTFSVAFTGMNTNAKTIKANSESYFKMDNGASIETIGNGDYGIRWTTFVSEEYVNALKTTYGDSAKIEFHTLIGPSVSNATTLTKAYADANAYKDRLCTAQMVFDGGEFAYHAYLRYSNLDQSLLKDAFNFNLTARAYVIVNENPATIAYADAPDTTRSMKGVASYMLANGLYDIDDKSALETYAGSAISEEPTVLGTTDCGYYSELDGEGKISLSGLDNGTYQVYVGAKKVADNFIVENSETANVTIKDVATVIEDNAVVHGNSYDLTVISSTGEVYTQPFKYVTKAISKASDLDAFKLSSEKSEIDGYYLLTDNINAGDYYTDSNPYKHDIDGKFVVDSGKFVGTFDGNGYTVSGLKITKTNGLFGNLSGATIKNVAFADATMSATGGVYSGFFAGHILAGTKIENVYIDLAYTPGATWGGAVAYQFGGGNNSDTVTMTNCIINVNPTSASGGSYYGSLGGQTEFISNTKVKAQNVCVVSDMVLFYKVSGAVTVDSITGITRKSDCGYYSALDESGKITLSGFENGTYEVYVGAQKVADNVNVTNSNKVEVNVGSIPENISGNMVVGNNYDFTVKSSTGKAYDLPFKYVTKAISKASDLDTFKLSSEKSEIDGYYLLTDNINAGDYYTDSNPYKHDIDGKFVANGGKFVGTFDGNGYTISGLKITKTNGLFGNLSGATIKNVAFTDATMSATGGVYSGFFAGHILAGTIIENVYIDLSYKPGATWGGAIAYQFGGGNNSDTVTMINCIINVNPTAASGGSYYGSLGGQTDFVNNTKVKAQNVYVVSNMVLFYKVSGAVTVDSITGITRANALPAKDKGYESYSSNYWNLDGDYPIWKTLNDTVQ